jgi:NhaP-type Na+/H+ or K+/H+ antiporter
VELTNPALTFTLALAAGIIAQSAARHLRVPGIVLLLLFGALLGPDAANLVRPDTLGGGLDILVGLSVAVILFEGGLSLNISRLRGEARVIRMLITVGAVITAAGAATAARLALDWPWPIAITFGTLVIVTGPTVITPLLRRIRVRKGVSTILEAEGVLIDPIGAILAVVALELALSETFGGAARGLLGIPSRLLLGATVGIIGGSLIAVLLRFRKLVPEGLENVFTLSLVLVVFQISDSLQHESGIMAAAAAGFVVGNSGIPIPRELREFKEQLTVLLVGLLFVLLAADVRLAEVTALGWEGLAVVAALMLVIRPLGVAASTWGSELSWKERSFIGWLGPRGIVAAAVASVFAQRLTTAGYEIGAEFRALVFLVIAVTVVVQGFTSGPVASLLGVRRRKDIGHIVVGANPLGRALGSALQSAGEEVVMIDSNPAEASEAERAGLRVIYGNANDESILLRADIEGRRSLSAVTPNESANVLLARTAKEEHRLTEALAALERGSSGLTDDRVRGSRIEILFGEPLEVEDWIHALRHGQAEVQHWRLGGTGEGAESHEAAREGMGPSHVPLVVVRDGSGIPVGQNVRFRVGDVVAFAVRSGSGAPAAVAAGEWVAVHDPEPAGVGV